MRVRIVSVGVGARLSVCGYAELDLHLSFLVFFVFLCVCAVSRTLIYIKQAAKEREEKRRHHEQLDSRKARATGRRGRDREKRKLCVWSEGLVQSLPLSSVVPDSALLHTHTHTHTGVSTATHACLSQLALQGHACLLDALADSFKLSSPALLRSHVSHALFFHCLPTIFVSIHSLVV